MASKFQTTSGSCRSFCVAACILLSAQTLHAASVFDIDKTREQFRTGEYAQCLESSQKAIEESAYQSEWRVLMIKSLTSLGRYDEAAERAEVVLQSYGGNIRLLKLAHDVYVSAGHTEKASELVGIIYKIATSRRFMYMNSQDVVALGQSLLLLGGEPKAVLDGFYNRAIQNDPNCRQAYLTAGDLALAKQDYELAANQYRKVLERFGDDPDAHYGLAAAFYYSDRQLMIASLDAALHVNPRHQESLVLLAEHQIDCENKDAASKLLDRAIAVNPWLPEAWAYRSLLAHLANDPNAAESCRANALKFWPTNPRVDYLIGRKLSQKYRFTEGSAHQYKALEFDRGYLPAKIQLAEDMLRLGDEQQGWILADTVHADDPYNVQAYNLVNLHDNLSKFETLRRDGFIIRMDKLEAAVYGDRVVKLLGQAKSVLCEKYGLQLDQPVTVELFPDQQDFAVRTFGMPSVDGFLGVCFGNVITANSPKAQRPSNWQSMLWHEFCHVVTLNMTGNKMPRWLSEGMSVYEERQQNPTWGQHMNPEYRSMILSGELTPVSELSGAFLSPPTPNHLQFAYYESSLVVEFLVERFGFTALKAILADLDDGKEINESISKRAGPIGKIEKDFEAFARKRAESLSENADWEQPDRDQVNPADPQAVAQWLEKHPNNIWALRLHAGYLLSDNKWEESIQALEKLVSLYPQYVGEGNAYELLAQAYHNLNQTEKEREVLSRLAEISSDASGAYERLMEIEMEAKNWKQVVENAEKYLAVYPMLGASYLKLGRASEELMQNEQAVEAYRRVLLLDPADPADINYRLARLLQDSDTSTAKRHILESLADAPRFRQGHRLLLKIIEAEAKPSTSAPTGESTTLTVQENTE